MRVPHGSVMYVMVFPAALLRTGSSDVVEHASSGRRLLCIRPGEPELNTWEVHDGSAVAGAGLPTEGLRIPSLSFGNLGFRHGQVDVFIPDRHRLHLVFQDFDTDTVRRHDEGLIQSVVVAREHCNTRGFPLGHPLLDVVDDEADVVHD